MAEVVRVLSLCGAYGLASSTLIFANRTLYQKYQFEDPNLLLFFQMLFNALFCTTLLIAYSSVSSGENSTTSDGVGPEPSALQCGISTLGLQVPKTKHLTRNLLPGASIALLNLVSVIAGLSSLKYVNIPMFLTLRRCGILFTLMVQAAF